MIHLRSVGGRDHLFVVRRRMSGDLAFGGKVAGKTPNFPCPVIIVKDEIPVVILAAGTDGDIRLQATI